MAKILQAVVEVERQRYYDSSKNWGIVICSVDKVIDGTPAYDENKFIIVKGTMTEPNVGGQYVLKGEEVNDPKWGVQYNIISFNANVPLTTDDKFAQKKYLSSIYTPLEVENMYDALENPYKALYEKDAASLVQVQGCGMKVANRWIERFHENLSIAKILLELSRFNLTNNMILKLLKSYNDNPDVVIDKVTNNPYILVEEVSGVGWKTADKIALEGGLDPYCPERISGYITYYLELCGENGRSWIYTDELLGAILDNLGEDVPDLTISETVRGMADEGKLWFNDDRDKIGLKRFYNLEKRVAEELIRIRDAESVISPEEYTDWEDNVRRQEALQGWEFTEEQRKGIELALMNNVVLIQGLAGSGKSSTVGGFLKCIGHHDFAQAALSGRAASRMQEITGEEGYTIHRLLGFPSRDEFSKGGFFFHDENKLPQDIYIVDEISMIGLELFYSLIRAIPDGAKVLLLGDYGQLESIGSGNIAYDILHSESIPSILLTKIHRQAAKSGIISESLKVRDGIQLVDKDWTGEEIRGELQDLTVRCFLDKNNTYREVLAAFSTEMNKPDFNILGTQIIVPVKKRGQCNTYELNNAIQELYNPKDGRKKETTSLHDGKLYILRVGDKVINRVNNYQTYPPIYNGNIGILKRFGVDDNDKDAMFIDFLGIGTVCVSCDYWNNIELAYALTCHSVQGSQFEYVIVGIDFDSYSLLTKELVYTALTRGMKRVKLIAQTGALRKAVATEGVSNKQTHLQECLYEIDHPKIIF